MHNSQNVTQHDAAQDRHKICVALSEINNLDAAQREEVCAQAIEMLTAAPALQERLERAERALLRAGFQDLGGRDWKPRLGKPPIFIEVGASAARHEPASLPPIYYVRDDHTTCRLPEHVEGALHEIKRELDDGFTCGGLFTKRIGAKSSLSFSYSVPQEEMLQRARRWLTEEIQARRNAPQLVRDESKPTLDEGLAALENMALHAHADASSGLMEAIETLRHMNGR